MSKYFSMLNIDYIYKMLQAKCLMCSLYTLSYEKLSGDLCLTVVNSMFEKEPNHLNHLLGNQIHIGCIVCFWLTNKTCWQESVIWEHFCTQIKRCRNKFHSEIKASKFNKQLQLQRNYYYYYNVCYYNVKYVITVTALCPHWVL